MDRLHQINPDAYEAAMKQQRLADEAFGLLRDVRANKPDANNQFRAKVGDMVEQWLTDRQARIDKLKKAIAEQEMQLANDQENKEKRVDEKCKQLMDDLDRMKRPERASSDTGSDFDPLGVILPQ